VKLLIYPNDRLMMRITRNTPIMTGRISTGSVSSIIKPGATLPIRRTELFIRLRKFIHNYDSLIAEYLNRYRNPVFSRSGPGQGFPDVYSTVFAQSDISVALARIGSTEEAERNLRASIGIKDIAYRAYVISSAAIALIELGRIDEASPLVSEAIKIESRQMSAYPILRSFAARRTNEALVLLGRNKEAIKRISVATFQNLPRAFIEIGEFERALTCSNIGKLERAHALAGCGRVDESLALAEPVKPIDKIHLLSEIAIALVHTGNLVKAEQVFAEIGRLPGRKCAPRTEIALAQLKDGRIEEALDTVGIINGYISGLQPYRSFETFDMLGRLAKTLLQIDPEIASGGRLAELQAFKVALRQVENKLKEQQQLEQEQRAETARQEEENRQAEARRQYEIHSAAESALREQEDRINRFREKMEEITSAIEEPLAKALGLVARHGATTSEGDDGRYASILTTGLRQAPTLSQRLTLQLSQFQLSVIDVREGMDEAALRRRLRCLNILVHHEVAHIIQRERKIPHPKIANYSRLNQQEARRQANEVLIDKLGFESARLIYVHGDGDVMFSEAIREAISIEAYITLCEIILENLAADVHKLSNGNAARIVAVLRQLALSNSIIFPIRNRLLELADIFWQRIRDNSLEERNAQFTQLINEYESIFAKTNLTL